MDEYRPLASPLDNRWDPPWRVKYSAADAFPPTFMVRSWVVDHESRLVDLKG